MKLIEISERTLIVSVARSFPRIEPDIYKATRCAWKVNASRIKKYSLVLARRGNNVVGAFRVKKWMKATRAPKWMKQGNMQGRYTFKGDRAHDWDDYSGKRVPEKYLTGRNPIRYCDPTN